MSMGEFLKFISDFKILLDYDDDAYSHSLKSSTNKLYFQNIFKKVSHYMGKVNFK